MRRYSSDTAEPTQVHNRVAETNRTITRTSTSEISSSIWPDQGHLKGKAPESNLQQGVKFAMALHTFELMMKRPLGGSRMPSPTARQTQKDATASPMGAARQVMPLILNAYAMFPPITTATASPVKIRACPMLRQTRQPSGMQICFRACPSVPARSSAN